MTEPIRPPDLSTREVVAPDQWLRFPPRDRRPEGMATDLRTAPWVVAIEGLANIVLKRGIWP